MPLSANEKLEVFRRATELIASSRSFDETMAHTIGACLPALGDFGFFDLVVGADVRRTSRAHDDARVEDILPTQWVRQERADMNLCALSTGKPALHPSIDDAWYRAIAINDGHLAVLRDLAFVSMISVPMRYQGELLGALTLFYGRSGRHFDENDLTFATDLAALAAPVVANARLLDQLRIGEERLRVGMDAGKLGVWDWDIKADRISCSDRVYDVFGISRGTFGGSLAEFSALIHPEDRDRVQQAVQAALAGVRPYDVECRMNRPDGTTRWCSSRAEVYRDEVGAPIRMVGAVYDVTERLELVADAARARAEAEHANKTKDKFLAMLGHELRNPLAPIVMALELMQARDQTTFRRERDIITRQITHLTRLVDDLLDISRIERGMVQLVRQRVEIVGSIEATIDAARATFEARGLTISLAATERPLYIDGDPTRFSQIIGNLIANAGKFSPRGEHVSVRIEATPSQAEVVVEDRGAGIDPVLLPRVFEPFVQGPQELARERGGLGVGLAIVANLVALHGGRVSAESEGSGKGSKFRVVFPRVAPTRATAPIAPPEPAPERARLRVLVVDDNVDSGELLGESLRARGHEVQISIDAKSALRMLESFSCDVAILDLGLPDIDGFELARRIRQQGTRTRLVALTGYGRDTDRDKTRDAGFDEHFVKPIDALAIHRRIVELARR